MGVSDRSVRTLLRRMEADGDGVVVHGLRGRSSNRQIDAQTQERAIVLLKQPEWHDFGPTFASEQLDPNRCRPLDRYLVLRRSRRCAGAGLRSVSCKGSFLRI
jgi:hypothetical protein